MAKQEKKAAEPMDPSARETAKPEAVVRNVRHAYALETLVAEVETVFGEAIVTYGDPNNWQVIHEVTFETPDSSPMLAEVLLEVARQDERLMGDVYLDDDLSQAFVQFWPNPRIRDSRDGFGLAEILAVFSEDEKA